jgi:hypothetical protein
MAKPSRPFPLVDGTLRGPPEPSKRVEHPLGPLHVASPVVLTVDQQQGSPDAVSAVIRRVVEAAAQVGPGRFPAMMAVRPAGPQCVALAGTDRFADNPVDGKTVSPARREWMRLARHEPIGSSLTHE